MCCNGPVVDEVGDLISDSVCVRGSGRVRGSTRSGGMIESPERSVVHELPGAPLHEPVLASCGTAFTWEDVVDWMREDGTWAEAARRAAQGLTLAAAGAGEPTGGQLRDEAHRFRRARRLIAGEDLFRWLAYWAISEEAWVDWMERTLRRLAVGAPAHPTREADARDIWVEAVCSGDLEAAASMFARALGAWAARSNGAPVPQVGRLDALQRAADELARAEAPHEEIERTISANAAAWVQVGLEWADFGNRDRACEAIASMRDDGSTLAEIAELARAEINDEMRRAEEFEQRMHAVAVSSPVGTPVLVFTPASPGVVAIVRTRRLPSAVNPDDVALAARSVAEERMQTTLDRWVTWRV